MAKTGRGGYRTDLGIYVRSGWEANYARYLNWLRETGTISSWEYEPCEFEFTAIKRGTRFYKPDFRVTNPDGSVEYHEVKGYMDKTSQTKLNRMAKYYPDVTVIVIDRECYRSITKQMRSLPHWE